jgi:hypothetical protein
MKKREKHLSRCVLLDQIITITMKSDKIRKKNAATQIKKKKTKLKKNERINKKHDKYIHIEDLKQETKINCERKST